MIRILDVAILIVVCAAWSALTVVAYAHEGSPRGLMRVSLAFTLLSFAALIAVVTKWARQRRGR